MPQEIRVLCCFKCKMYQVDIVKKAKKWQCKMCQEKQSVFKEFFRGSGAECRLKVQELNLNINTQKNEVENQFLGLLDNDDLDIDLEAIVNEHSKKNGHGQVKIKDSKWAKYVDIDERIQFQEEEEKDIEPTVPLCKLKRKAKSSNITEDDEFHCAKNPRPLTTCTSSKWNKYL